MPIEGNEDLFGCGGFGIVEMTDKYGEPTFGFYLSEIADAEGAATLGLQLGCCNDTSVCWIAEFTVHLERVLSNGTAEPLGHVRRKVAITPCSGTCRIPGTYETGERYPIAYHPPGTPVPDNYPVVLTGDGVRDSWEVEHTLAASDVVAIPGSSFPQREVTCRPMGDSRVIIEMADGLPLGAGQTLSLILIRGKVEEYKDTWAGDGVTKIYEVNHSFDSTLVTVQTSVEDFPDSVIDGTTPPITMRHQIIDENTVWVWPRRNDGTENIALDAGYRVDIVVRHVRPFLPEEEPGEDELYNEDSILVKPTMASHQQFSWGGTFNMNYAASVGDSGSPGEGKTIEESHGMGVQIMGVHFGEHGYYNRALDGRRARIMIADGSLVGLTMGTNAFSSNRGADMPAISWQPVTECMWDEGASPFEDYGGNGMAEGEWPLDGYGDQVPFFRSERFFDRDYFFTLPTAASLTPMCAFAIESMAQPPYQPVLYDMYTWTNLKWFIRPQDESAVWHGRCNFEYRCSPDADDWLRANGETMVIGGAVYLADEDFKTWIATPGADGGLSWYNAASAYGVNEGDEPYIGEMPPFAISKLLLPTFPSGAPYDEELQEEAVATANDPDFIYYQSHDGTLPPVDPDAPPVLPWTDPALSAPYPEAWNEQITDEMRAFWFAKGYGQISPYYVQHPKPVYPDAKSGRKDENTSFAQMLPFYDAASLGKPGYNVRVTGMTLNRWRKCGEEHMCAQGLFPVFSDQQYIANQQCWTYDTVPIFQMLRTENGGAWTAEMYRYPGPLMETLKEFARKDSDIPADDRWVGNDIDNTREFQHNRNDLTPQVDIVVDGSGLNITWYVPNADPNKIVLYTVDPLTPGQPGAPLDLNAIVVTTVTRTGE